MLHMHLTSLCEIMRPEQTSASQVVLVYTHDADGNVECRGTVALWAPRGGRF
jgi:hypothetical protein